MGGKCSVSLNNDSRKQKRVCRIGVSVEAMKAMRFVVGDRIQVFGDSEHKALLLARVVTGGSCSLCPQGGKTQDHAGKIAVACLQFTAEAWLREMLPATLARCSWEATTEGLVIQLPA